MQWARDKEQAYELDCWGFEAMSTHLRFDTKSHEVEPFKRSNSARAFSIIESSSASMRSAASRCH